jgi:hypothetical protein
MKGLGMGWNIRIMEWKRILGSLLDRGALLVDLLIVAVFAAFCAAAATQLLVARADAVVRGIGERAEVRGGGSGAGAGAGPKDGGGDFEPVTGEAILKRNMFDSAVGPLLPKRMEEGDRGPEAGGGQGEDQGPQQLSRCEMQLPVVGLFASKDPSWSFAAVKQGGDIDLLSVGQSIQTHRVSAITWTYLFMSPADGGAPCFIDIWDQPPERPGPPPKAPPAAAKPGGAGGVKTRLKDLAKQYVHDISPTEKNVDSRLVSFVFQNLDVLAKEGGRGVPKLVKGKVQGYRIFNIDKESLWATLGIRNGDVVRSINGKPMTSPVSALEAFKQMRGADRIAIDIERGGKEKILNLYVK